MSAQTLTIGALAVAQAHEDWRDQMISLGIETYWQYEMTSQIDTDTAVTVANALNDIRVRDCLMWHMVRYSCPDLVTPILDHAIPLLPGKPGAQAALVAAVAFALQDMENECAFAIAYAVNYDRDNRMIQLAGLTFAQGGASLLKKAMQDMMADLTYDEVRIPFK
jgi:hypothetical protein